MFLKDFHNNQIMAEKKDHFTVEVSVMDLRLRLQTMLATGTKDSILLAKTIVNLLGHSEAGHQRLYLAMTGIDPACKWKVGDQVYIPLKKAVYSWDCDLPKTEASELNVQGFLAGVVEDTDDSCNDNVSVKVLALDDAGKQKEITRWHSAKLLTKCEEDAFFERVSTKDPNDDLPF
jgi:hypothetical protein